MSNLILTRRAGQCVRLELSAGVFITVMVAYVGGEQIKLEMVGGDGSNLTKRVNVGDGLTIAEDVVVTVMAVTFRVVRLAFNAPLNVKIVRTELLERAL
jgi:carbon storage regulator CsrA